jgi:hypothetical protein
MFNNKQNPVDLNVFYVAKLSLWKKKDLKKINKNHFYHSLIFVKHCVAFFAAYEAFLKF